MRNWLEDERSISALCARTALFISPHFDDAVGSCGGTICRLVQQGRRVHLLTVFGGTEIEPLSALSKRLHRTWKVSNPIERRREEDAHACALLGCTRSFLPIPEALYRRGTAGVFYRTASELFGARATEDDPLVEKIVDTLLEVASTGEGPLFFPLGIGQHVDHLIVREVGSRLKKTNCNVIYYEDFYYRAFGGDEMRKGQCVRVTLSGEELRCKTEAFLMYETQVRGLFDSVADTFAHFETHEKVERYYLC